MKQEMQTTPNKKNQFEVGTQIAFTTEPTAPNIVMQGINRVVDYAKLETRMFVFDAIHKTNYRTIRHNLIRQEKRRRFEESIGLIALNQ